MPCQSNEELENILLEAKQYSSKGKVADYIPALSKANPADLSVAIYHSDGTCYSAGCIHKKITLQSISKVITLALALIESGEEFVFSKVGYEPTGIPLTQLLS